MFMLMAPIGGILYRIRGGWGKKKYLGGSTHLARLVWSIPTGFLLFYGTTPDTTMWYRVFLCIGAVWASMALYGHGAHMIFDMRYWTLRWAKGDKVNVTENLTSWWLPKLFGGSPDVTWNNNDLVRYNLLGMSTIGVVRNFTAVLPIILLAPMFVLIYTLAGLLHGPVYWLGQKLQDWFGLMFNGSEVEGPEWGEFLVGFHTYAIIGAYFYG